MKNSASGIARKMPSEPRNIGSIVMNNTGKTKLLEIAIIADGIGLCKAVK